MSNPNNRRLFKVCGWCGGMADEFDISDRLSAEDVVAMPGDTRIQPSPTVYDKSTSWKNYSDKMDDLLEHLQNHGGKVVLSRTVCGDATRVDWIKVAERYFQVHAEAFRYMYYTPRHGFWIGASPEVLLRADNEMFHSMALAGTRSVADDGEKWSPKNIAEQAIVRNYIVDRFYELGLEPVCGATETLTTGNLQHLCTRISSKRFGVDPQELLNALNPTPALAGYPLSAALELIVASEAHPRRCYGGYVALVQGDDLDAFVNLRCVNFGDKNFCMYVGSGIMPDSDAEDEWKETEMKAVVLKDIIATSTESE